MEFDLQLFGPAAAWLVPAGLSLVGSIMSNNQQGHAADQASGAAQQATDSQNALNSQMMAIYNGMSDQYKQYYAPLLQQISQQYGAMDKQASTDQTATYNSSVGQLMNNPTNSYALDHFMNESKQGMDPAIKEYALGQIRRQGQSSIANLGHSLGPSIPNVSGLAGDIAEKSLEAQVDESARLATGDQSLRDQATNQAAGYGQQQIQDMLKAFGLSSGVLDTSNQFIQQGKSFLPGAAQGIGGLAGTYGQAAGGFAGNAAAARGQMTNPFSTLGNYAANNPFPGWGHK